MYYQRGGLCLFCGCVTGWVLWVDSSSERFKVLL